MMKETPIRKNTSSRLSSNSTSMSSSNNNNRVTTTATATTRVSASTSASTSTRTPRASFSIEGSNNKKKDNKNNINENDNDNDNEDTFEDAPITQGFLSKRRKRMRYILGKFNDDNYSDNDDNNSNEWMRPYWLGSGLFLMLFAFWLLDSLKDPIFARLVHGNLKRHQPPAKIFSVMMTLVLVCCMEYIYNQRQQQQRKKQQQQVDEETFWIQMKTKEEILDPGGTWNKMSIEERRQSRRQRQQQQQQQHSLDDTVSIWVFLQIGIPYAIAFGIIAYFIHSFKDIELDRQQQQQQQMTMIMNENDSNNDGDSDGSQRYSRLLQLQATETIINSATNTDTTPTTSTTSETFDVWYILAYAIYATIESFGSISVATFWSYTNSTLALSDAERYYGPIIAIAQIGAIGGSTMVASDHWDEPTLFVSVSLIIILQVLLMWVYDRRFQPTSALVTDNNNNRYNSNYNDDDEDATIFTWQDDNVTDTKPFWSGLYLIFRHYYVLLILGVSCLYEISLTCLDYQMKLLGWARFQGGDDDATITNEHGDIQYHYDDSHSHHHNNNNSHNSHSGHNHHNTDNDNNMTFSQFMGRYGQVVNMTSLFCSSIIFPWLIRKFGLRITLRLFPTCLLLVTLIAYLALPGNLAVLFVSLSILKAMTYSIHDPSKEILYIPTSNAVKFRAKFWIDIVGERISKAIGSAVNTFAAGSVDRSVQIVASIPSLVSAAGLWMVCFYAGVEFDRLLITGKVVGLDQSSSNRDPRTYKQVSQTDDDNNNNDDDGNGTKNNHNKRPSEVEITFGHDSLSTIGPLFDSTHNIRMSGGTDMSFDSTMHDIRMSESTDTSTHYM